jgi:diguanylate cyclase (GGDEF)-like protein
MARGFHFGWSIAQKPAKSAIPAIAVGTLLTELVDFLSPPYVWFGPVYLLLIGFAAWFVSSRFAIALGLLVILCNLLAGYENAYPYGPNFLILNFVLRALCVLALVFVLRLSRRSLQREWLLARIDPLTGALNRQAFFEAIKADCVHCGYTPLVFADLDGLKNLNDEMGHELGDNGLRDFADRARSAIRKNDLFARIGGDEFVFLMKVRDQAAAEGVVKRLDRTLNLDAKDGMTTLKCSLGALLLPAGSKSIDDELRAADKLMYSANRADAGLAMALAVEVDGQMMLSPPLELASTATRSSVVRTRDLQSDCGVRPGRISLAEASAA